MRDIQEPVHSKPVTLPYHELLHKTHGEAVIEAGCCQSLVKVCTT